MASSSTHSNMIQFPCLPSVQDHWNTSRDQPLLPMRRPGARDSRTLKPSKSTESLTQRKDRVEFLRRREWTRRVSGGADQPPSASRRARTYSWEDIVAAADAAADAWDYPYAPPQARRPDTIDELDEADEPYIIYTATPRAAAYTPPPVDTQGPIVLYSTSPSPPSHSPSPTLSPLPAHSSVRDLSPPASAVGGGPYYPRRVWRGPHSRHSSLSSISEEDEGLARF